MFKNLILLISTLFFTMTSHAESNIVNKKSHYDVPTTVQRFEAALAEKGIKLTALVNHTDAGKMVGMPIRETQLLIFGNPKLGSALMQSEQLIGLDLPLKALVWEDNRGDTWVSYYPPKVLAQRYGIKDQDTVVKKMTAVLSELTAKATQP